MRDHCGTQVVLLLFESFVFGVLMLLSLRRLYFESVCFVCCAKNENVLKKKKKKKKKKKRKVLIIIWFELRFDLIPSSERKRRYVGNLDRFGHNFEKVSFCAQFAMKEKS